MASGDVLRWADLFSRYNAQATRRDKWFRLAQYISRLTVLNLTNTGTGKELVIGQFKKLESSLADGRRLFRLFGSVDFLVKAVALYRKPDPDHMITAMGILGNICKALWLIHDHFVWIGKVGLLQVNFDRLSKNGAICWAAAMACLIIRDLKQVTAIELEIGRVRASQRYDESLDDEEATVYLRAKRRDLQSAQNELLKDCLDLMLPLGTLGRVTPKLSTACGILSTLVSIKQEWVKLT